MIPKSGDRFSDKIMLAMLNPPRMARFPAGTRTRIAQGGDMTNDIDRAGVAKAYGAWAPIYDMVFGKVFDEGRKSTIAVADAIGGRVLDVGVGTGLSLSDYSRSPNFTASIFPSRCCARRSVRAQNLTNVETLSVMDEESRVS
jgi:phosphatidylethanolamine/phosphatidyl-N-methylethanolamine N-methyltransferase